MDEVEFLPLFCDVVAMADLHEAGITAGHFADEIAAGIFQEAFDYYLGSGCTMAITPLLIEDDRPDRVSWIEAHGWPEEASSAKEMARGLKEKWTRFEARRVLLEAGERIEDDPQGGVAWGVSALAEIARSSTPRSRIT